MPQGRRSRLHCRPHRCCRCGAALQEVLALQEVPAQQRHHRGRARLWGASKPAPGRRAGQAQAPAAQRCLCSSCSRILGVRHGAGAARHIAKSGPAGAPVGGDILLAQRHAGRAVPPGHAALPLAAQVVQHSVHSVPPYPPAWRGGGQLSWRVGAQRGRSAGRRGLRRTESGQDARAGEVAGRGRTWVDAQAKGSCRLPCWQHTAACLPPPHLQGTVRELGRRQPSGRYAACLLRAAHQATRSASTTMSAACLASRLSWR